MFTMFWNQWVALNQIKRFFRHTGTIQIFPPIYSVHFFTMLFSNAWQFSILSAYDEMLSLWTALIVSLILRRFKCNIIMSTFKTKPLLPQWNYLANTLMEDNYLIRNAIGIQFAWYSHQMEQKSISRWLWIQVLSLFSGSLKIL